MNKKTASKGIQKLVICKKATQMWQYVPTNFFMLLTNVK